MIHSRAGRNRGVTVRDRPSSILLARPRIKLVSGRRLPRPDPFNAPARDIPRPMSHSVRSHLRIEIGAYDTAIRTFLPGYDEMLALVARTVAETGPGHVLDLGAGARHLRP